MIYVLGLLIALCVAAVVFIWRLPSSVPAGLEPAQPEARFKRLEERIASLELEFKRTYQSLILEKEGKIDSADLELKRQKLAELEKELERLGRDNQKLQKEKEKQESVIIQLRQKEEQLNKQAADLKKQLKTVTAEFEAAKKREEDLKDKLFKLRVIHADGESELKQVKKDNEALRNELQYEKSY